MKRVGTAELKAHLSKYLKRVRRGETITVLDRREAIARIVPLQEAAGELSMRAARGSLRDVALPGPIRSQDDVVAALIRERADRL